MDVCKCGYLKTEHVDEAIKPEDFTGESWDRHRHIREVPTDAFGDISFGGFGQKTRKVRESYLLTTIPQSECVNVYLHELWKFVSTFSVCKSGHRHQA